MSAGDPHLTPDALLEYWLGESSPGDTDAAEEHLMRCEPCGEALDELIALGGAVREAVRSGDVWAVTGSALAQRMVDAGRRVREYRLPHNGSVKCTVAPEDEALVGRMAVPLQGVQRIDILKEFSHAPGVWHRMEDIPFDPDAGEVVWLARLARIREVPEHTMRVKLLAVDPGGTRELGTYTFRHRPWPGWDE
jgi:hypothetical protein